ncbi:SRPBCC family protein [Crossiella sp. CA198]|uniref:SRPBCC family protein n=1 Tax=Crossiella sp. CA198 TaxID=3455607 RepID=UPI003F8D4529
MRLYIENTIKADPAALWARTQDPAQHQRWDLRFHRIEYLPPAPGEPQHFRYATFGVAGAGVSVGERRSPDGSSTSALRFASAHPLSLIRSGSGYWRYRPGPHGVRFITGYDYRPGWGRLGPLADLLFRPLMGWATAWSFDRLRLWLEEGISPESALRRALADLAVRLLLTLVTLLLTPWPTALATALLALFAPPAPGVPAARRCLRRPPDALAATAPATLSRLELP